MQTHRYRSEDHSPLDVARFADFELDPQTREQLRRQIGSCPECQQMLADLSAVTQKIGQYGRVQRDVPVYLDRRVVEDARNGGFTPSLGHAATCLAHWFGEVTVEGVNLADRVGRSLLGPCQPTTGGYSRHSTPPVGYSWADRWQSGLSVLLARSTRETYLRLAV